MKRILESLQAAPPLKHYTAFKPVWITFFKRGDLSIIETNGSKVKPEQDWLFFHLSLQAIPTMSLRAPIKPGRGNLYE